MIVYFSGTGNSRFAAEYMARHLGDETINANQLIKAGERLNCVSDRPWVFAAPIYGWQMPRVFESFLRQAQMGGSKDAYFVLTCGSDIGAAGTYARQMCEEIGLHYCGILEVVMPENYLAMFPVPNEQKAIEIVKKAVPVLDAGIVCLHAGAPFPEHKTTILDEWKSGFINRWFYRLFVKAAAFKACNSCIGCGKCAQVCPMNNIKLERERPVWGKDCTHCMACICDCPAHAIEYGRISVGKPRYHCPVLE